jgi:uncharacterized protein
MCPIVDTSVFAAFINKKDKHHVRAQEIFSDIRNGAIPHPISNDYILDETVTLVRRRTGRHDLAVQVADLIMRSRDISFTYVLKDDIQHAVDEYKKCSDKDLSFTDWISVCYIRKMGLKMIIAFDEHFDKVGIERIY